MFAFRESPRKLRPPYPGRIDNTPHTIAALKYALEKMRHQNLVQSATLDFLTPHFGQA